MSAPAGETVRVSTLELFFDLVFVFTITQLTSVLVHDTTLRGLARVVLMLGVIWWMYGGYAWLTNAVTPSDWYRRVLLLTGMVGFLVVALAIPRAYGAAGLAFGLGYLLVDLVHTALFISAGGPGAARAMSRLGWLNLGSAGLVVAGGLAPAGWRYALWASALALQIASPYLHRIGGFSVRPGHFAERHGLVIIVALGESVVAIGAGVGGMPVTPRLVAVSVLGLVLAFALWWAYFGGDDVRAEHALAGIADPTARARAALRAFGYAHYPMLLGIVCLAAGVKSAIGHPTARLHWPAALALAGGVALFLAGEVWFRRILHIGPAAYRAAAGLLVLLTVPLGVRVAAAAQIAALAVILGLALAAERRLRPARAAGARPAST